MIKVTLSLLFICASILSFAQCPELTIDYSFSDPLCHDSEDGSITLTASGGAEPYIYEIRDEAGELINDVGTNTASDLMEGLYTFTITDNTGCDTTREINLNAPLPLIFSDFGSSDITGELPGLDGNVYMGAAGGTPNYAYLWTSVETGDTWTNSTVGGLDVGCYIGTITDDHGCQKSATACIGWVNLETDTLPRAEITYYQATKNMSITFDQSHELNIYNLNGQIIFKKQLSGGTQTIPLNLEQGIYIYEVKSNDQIAGIGRFAF
jgi:hypothetical protein